MEGRRDAERMTRGGGRRSGEGSMNNHGKHTKEHNTSVPLRRLLPHKLQHLQAGVQSRGADVKVRENHPLPHIAPTSALYLPGRHPGEKVNPLLSNFKDCIIHDLFFQLLTAIRSSLAAIMFPLSDCCRAGQRSMEVSKQAHGHRISYKRRDRWQVTLAAAETVLGHDEEGGRGEGGGRIGEGQQGRGTRGCRMGEGGGVGEGGKRRNEEAEIVLASWKRTSKG